MNINYDTTTPFEKVSFYDDDLTGTATDLNYEEDWS